MIKVNSLKYQEYVSILCVLFIFSLQLYYMYGLFQKNLLSEVFWSGFIYVGSLLFAFYFFDVESSVISKALIKGALKYVILLFFWGILLSMMRNSMIFDGESIGIAFTPSFYGIFTGTLIKSRKR